MSCLGKTAPKLSYLFFSSWGLNAVTNAFTDIRQFDPRWPVTISAQKYLFVTKKFSWLWEQLFLPRNLQNLLVGVDTIFSFFLLGKQITIWKEKWRTLRLVVKTRQCHPSTPRQVPDLLRHPRCYLTALNPGSRPMPSRYTNREHFFKVRPWIPRTKAFIPKWFGRSLFYSKGGKSLLT